MSSQIPKHQRDGLRPSAKSALLIALLAFGGCNTPSPIKVVSPRVTGRVVDARSHEPIRNVTVQRRRARNSHDVMEVPKGGELLKQPPVVRTDADGKFTLQCERDLTIFRSATWFSVRISFEHPRYDRFVATYTAERATNNPNGEPLLETGDVTLAPKVK